MGDPIPSWIDILLPSIYVFSLSSISGCFLSQYWYSFPFFTFFFSPKFPLLCLNIFLCYESALLVGLITTSIVQNYLKAEIPDPSDWNSFHLVYDNMCHLRELRLLQNSLDLPSPYCDMWQKFNCCIDELHIRNHTRESCKRLYNTDLLKAQHPFANTMAAEQTFCWLSRYKKILNSMGKTHFHFLLHRLVVGRNSYTQRCYQLNRRPLLPNAKIMRDK